MAVSFAALLFWIASLISVEPKGRFHESGVSWLGEAYYEFRDGRVKLVLLHPKPGRGRVEMQLGACKLIDDQWTLVSDNDASTMRVRATLFSITISEEDGSFARRHRRKWF